MQVGATESNWKWNWKYWEDAYNSAANKISHPSSSGRSSSSGDDSGSEGSSSSDSDSSDSSDDDEPALAAIVAASMHRDGTACTASKAELRLTKELAKDKRDIKGRDGKLARIRQQEEAEAAAARARLGLEPSTSSGELQLQHKFFAAFQHHLCVRQYSMLVLISTASLQFKSTACQ